jgi:hypothetical protein
MECIIIHHPLPCSHKAAYDLFSEPDESNPYLQFYCTKIHCNIIIPCTSRSPKLCLLYRLSNRILDTVSHVLATYPAHLIVLVIPGEEWELWSSSCDVLKRPVISSLLGWNVFLNSLSWNILNLCFPLTRETKFNTHMKQQAKWVVSYRDFATLSWQRGKVETRVAVNETRKPIATSELSQSRCNWLPLVTESSDTGDRRHATCSCSLPCS